MGREMILTILNWILFIFMGLFLIGWIVFLIVALYIYRDEVDGNVDP